MSVSPEYIRLNRYKYPNEDWIFDEKKSRLEKSSNDVKDYAVDISHNVLSVGEVTDEKAINESLTLLLLTMKGELIFRHHIGTSLPMVPFENINSAAGNEIIDTVLDELQSIEKRIAFVKDRCRVNVDPDNNQLQLCLYYYIIESGQIGKYQQTIST